MNTSNKKTKQITYLILFVSIMIVKVLITTYIHDKIVSPYVNRVLTICMIYCFIRIFKPDSIRLLPFYIWLFAVSGETIQYFEDVSSLFTMISGFIMLFFSDIAFSWPDIICYSTGAILCFAFEYFFLKLSPKKKIISVVVIIVAVSISLLGVHKDALFRDGNDSAKIVEIESESEVIIRPHPNAKIIKKHFIILDADYIDLDGLYTLTNDFLQSNVQNFIDESKTKSYETSRAYVETWFYRESHYLPKDWQPSPGFFDNDTLEYHKRDLIAVYRQSPDGNTEYHIIQRARKGRYTVENIKEYYYENDILKKIRIEAKNTKDKATTIYPDSDNDGLSDWDEYILGSSIKNSDSDNDGVLDSSETYEQVIHEYIPFTKNYVGIAVSVTMDSSQNIENDIHIYDGGHDFNFYNGDYLFLTYDRDPRLDGIENRLSMPVYIYSDVPFEKVRIAFSYREKNLGDTNADHLQIAWYDETKSRMEYTDSWVDKENSTVITDIDHLGTFFLIADEKPHTHTGTVVNKQKKFTVMEMN